VANWPPVCRNFATRTEPSGKEPKELPEPEPGSGPETKEVVMRRRQGFTLIELLVVIAIIAILAAILFPVFAQARESARMTSCLSNMRQWGNAFQMYTQDFDAKYPLAWCNGIWPQGGVGYDYAVYPYIKNLGMYACPSNPTYPRQWPLPLRVDYPGSYSTNGDITAIRDANGNIVAPAPCFRESRTESEVQFPATTILMTEIRDTRRSINQGPEHEIFMRNKRDVCSRVPFNIHRGGANYMFTDGHAKWQKVQQTWKEWRINNLELPGVWPNDCQSFFPPGFQP
jgi:prepilin-type N-terminal cleavage/methylation domain-containing protein/prepilin-type processing-associated H-X9-DG protein